jgi:hypothetical protein
MNKINLICLVAKTFFGSELKAAYVETCQWELTSTRFIEAHNAATDAKPIPARAKMSSAVLNCLV